MPTTFDPTSGPTFEDLILDVAIELGVAKLVDGSGNPSAPQIPTDPHDLDLCKRAVNNGYQDFLRGDPTLKAHHWTFLDVHLDLALNAANRVEGDTSRYRLPPEISGRPRSAWSLTDSSNGRTGLKVQDTATHRVVMALATSDLSGAPVMASVRPIRAADPAAPFGWEVICYPRPDRDYVMSADFRIHPTPLVELTDRPIEAALHGPAYRACAVWDVKKRDDTLNPEDRQTAKAERDRAILASIGLDLQNVPRTLGLVTDPGVMPDSSTRLEAAQTIPRGTVTYRSS